MGMGMRLPPIPREIMAVLMVFVVDVRVGMVQCFMHMPVPMGLGQMQPHANAHQNRGDPERRWRRLSQPVSYTHLDVYKRQPLKSCWRALA